MDISNNKKESFLENVIQEQVDNIDGLSKINYRLFNLLEKLRPSPTSGVSDEIEIGSKPWTISEKIVNNHDVIRAKIDSIHKIITELEDWI